MNTWMKAINALISPAVAIPHQKALAHSSRRAAAPGACANRRTVIAAATIATDSKVMGHGRPPTHAAQMAAKRTHAAAAVTVGANCIVRRCPRGAANNAAPHRPNASNPFNTVGDGGALNASNIGAPAAIATMAACTRS
jgi:hypothetical protein